jgi:hypothetical protein
MQRASPLQGHLLDTHFKCLIWFHSTIAKHQRMGIVAHSSSNGVARAQYHVLSTGHTKPASEKAEPWRWRPQMQFWGFNIWCESVKKMEGLCTRYLTPCIRVLHEELTMVWLDNKKIHCFLRWLKGPLARSWGPDSILSQTNPVQTLTLSSPHLHLRLQEHQISKRFILQITMQSILTSYQSVHLHISDHKPCAGYKAYLCVVSELGWLFVLACW